MSKHQTFIEDEVNLDITGFNWQDRREGFFHGTQKDYSVARSFDRKQHSTYLLIQKGQSPLDLGSLV
jgi:hypothetical protein